MVRSDRQVMQLSEHCEHVYVDLRRGEAPDPRSIVSDWDHREVTEDHIEIQKLRERDYEQQTELHEEMTSASNAYDRLSGQIGDVMQELREGKKLDVDALKEGVDEMIQSIVRNPDAFACLTELRKKDVYTYRHSLGASIWAATFGRHLGLPKDSIRNLALGGLLLDVGKAKLPLDLLNKAGRLNEQELDAVRSHVEHSVNVVSATGGIPDVTREMVATHHERFDGGGYPRGLKGKDIPLFGRIAGIVDTYDALTSPRIYAQCHSPHSAINVLYEWRDAEFQTELVEQFIQAIGIYPTGTLVELSTDEVGVVISLNGARRLRPKIMVILDENKTPYDSFREIDLLEEERAGNQLTIRRGLAPGAFGIDTENLFI